MIISYLGKEFVKISQGDLVIAVNPISKDSKYSGKVARFGAAIALSTTDHPDYNGIETVTYGDNAPVAITGAGEYEVKDIFIRGNMTRTTIGGKEFVTTMYSFGVENISIAFLGPLSVMPKVEELEGVESPDILFIAFGDGLLDAATAYKLAVKLEPGIIIPIDCDEKSLKAFLKEAGEERVEPVEKLTLKKKDLDGKEGDVVVLSHE